MQYDYMMMVHIFYSSMRLFGYYELVAHALFIVRLLLLLYQRINHIEIKFSFASEPWPRK